MLFHSYVFIFAFLPAAMLLYYGLNHLEKYTVAKVALITASLFFYGYNQPHYVPVLVTSVGINYGLHNILTQERKAGFRKTCLIFGIVFDVGMLGVFKYLGFFTENVNRFLGDVLPLPEIALPLGISFFTFQQISLLVDSYRHTAERYRLVDYALFVTFFPQLSAGPISLHSEIVPQLMDKAKKKINYDNVAAGIRYVSLGMAKKVLLADSFGKIVDAGFADVWALGRWEAVSVMLCYTMQIYFDFSGYCDTAMGIGKLFNIDLPINFNSPYKATGIGEFWKRWHMTLTRFFTTYLYIPLGGSRKGKWRTYLNVMIIFTVSGLWHGADWSFVLWGMLHGMAMVAERMCKGKITLPGWLGYILTFGFVNVAWVFFRADSIGQAVSLLGRMVRGNGTVPWMEFAAVLAAFLLVVFGKNTRERVEEKELSWTIALVDSVLFVVSVFWLSQVTSFVYFNF